MKKLLIAPNTTRLLNFQSNKPPIAPRNARNNSQRAFSLAEVLITLGIIGVVAALSIPTLMNNINDAQYKTAYKKAFSVAGQALTSANGQDLFEYATGGGDSINHKKNFLAYMNQFKVTKQCTSGSDTANCWNSTGEKYGLNFSSGYPGNDSYAFIDSSGFAWTMYHPTTNIIFVDTNGFKKPNQWGKDRFSIFLLDDKKQAEVGIPVLVAPMVDNEGNICTSNKCAVEQNYFGTSWLYN